MSTASSPRSDVVLAAGLLRCPRCGGGLGEERDCDACRFRIREDSGILLAIESLEGTNRIAADFYDSPTWSRFQFWEDVFLWCQGPGPRRARQKLLRHLSRGDRPLRRVLEVGIGDGQNLALLPADCEVFGVDIAQVRLRDCLRKHPRMAGRLVWAEGEALPFADRSFDAVWTMGGLNYFRDPGSALREMQRVVRPGGTLLAADESATLYRLGLGHVLGLEWLDRLCLRLMGLPRDFVQMVLETPDRVTPAAERAWPGHERLPIWNRLGYCLLDVGRD